MQNNNFIKAILSGVAASVISMLFSTLIISLLIHAGRADDRLMVYGVLIILMLSAFAGSLVALKIVMAKRIVAGVITGLIYGLFLLGITALFFDGVYQGVIPTLLAVLGISLVPGVISISGNRGTKKNPKYRKIVNLYKS